MKPALLLCVGIVCSTGGVTAPAQSPEPVPGVRRIQDIPDAQEKPNPHLLYRIVLDMKTVADSPSEVGTDLELTAGLVNTFRAYGISAEHLQIAAVFHGATIVQLTDDASYKGRGRGLQSECRASRQAACRRS